MANIKVSELTTATVFNDSDLAMIVQDGASKKITKSKILESLNDSITIGLSTDLSYTSSTRGKIPFDMEMAKVGTKLTFSDNGIVIGAGVNFIEVSATSLQSASNADLCGVLITKNGTTLNNAVAVGFSYITTPNQMHCISLSPAIIPVSEGDVLYLVGYINTPAVTVQLQAYNGRANYLTAKVVS